MAIPALSIGVSALRMNETRVAVAADNIANATNRVALDPAARPQGETGYTPRTVAPVSLDGGGVRATIQAVDPASTAVPNGQGGVDAMPNVDLTTEIITLNDASRSYESAASVIRTADEMQQTLLDVVG
ncbi:flagellar biosynthesis protein FlgG [Roseospira marina]|uniref:Flagellar biosynthesis protein FlgG n=1 Tax=Roseospira marina TaxID=140057 RepID=A0A5M6IB08_9PROT|nr:flagellar basal body rod C-terminal domain-containing protein [Roseospira marina]KAA5605480.1 flagellar biosynthesis protein FlgG [Roseospira marina]MBB4314517.1 flagellar basal body rod protein FlgC [Roseospira marina]MBB5088655.1 flagellar basal body rod protein FlgC [Roseospira marina]